MIITKLFPGRIVFGLLALFLVYQGVIIFLPEPRQFSAPEKNAVQTAADTVAAALREKVASPARIGIAHFVNDPNDEVSETVKSTLIRTAADSPWKVREGSVIQQFLKDVSKTVVNATSMDEVINAGRRVKLDILVAGKVEEVKLTEDGAVARIRPIIYDLQSGDMLMNETVSAVWHGSDTAVAGSATAWRGFAPGLWGWAGWGLCILGLPWLTSFAIAGILEKKSNIASAVLLVGYTAADLLLGWLWTGFPLDVPGPIVIPAIGVLACALYNYWACETIAAK